jgi:DNA-binding MarR family transcriptional regulator
VTGAGSGPAPAPGAPAGHGEYECARAWSALTAAHARVAGRLATALARRCGLTINDFEILLRLEHEGSLRLGELSPAVPLTQPALSRAVARLADRGCLSRSGDPRDRRGVRITIAPAGRDLLRAAIPVHAATVRAELLDQLTPAEQDLLTRALTRVAAPPAPHSEPPPPAPGAPPPGAPPARAAPASA